LGVLRYLLDEGAQVDLEDPKGWTALYRACCLDRGLEVVLLLLEHGADAAAAVHDGPTPLMAASYGGHTEVVALLLAHGCGNIDLQDSNDGATALHEACWLVDRGVVRLLLGAGADPHAVDNVGRTPLALAAQERQGEAVAVLQVSA
jgi:ankyrin repeat protein